MCTFGYLITDDHDTDHMMIIAMMTNIWWQVDDIEVDCRQKNYDDNHTMIIAMMTMMMTNRSATSRSIIGSSIGKAETEHKVPTSEEGGQDDDIDCHDYNHDQYDDHYDDHDHEYHKIQLQRKVARNHDHYGIG